MDWLRKQLSRRPLPLWAVATADVLVFAIALNVFALFHHVLPRNETSTGIVSKRVSTAQAASEVPYPEPVATSEAAPAPSVEPDPVGVFTHRFEGRFTDSAVIANSEGYQSPNLNIRYSKHEEPGLVYYVADIYIRKIECLRTAFAKDKFGRGRYEWISDMSERLGGILAINGDYYGGRRDGIVIRNGEYFRNDDNPLRDICIINWDGTMDTYDPEAWDPQMAMDRGAYQGWNFGPILLDDEGNARTEFDSEVGGNNPRTAIGYYEPGHYCFVVVDGRSKSSKGITLAGLSQIMHDLGCAQAYNFDGGQSSEMLVNSKVISRPVDGGRKSTDAVLIVEADG